jgi:tetratricopeptide (TPR) repeat protein
LLTQWLTGGRRPVLAVVAIGGMGKSALTWAWLQRDVLGLPLPGLAADLPEAAERCRTPEDRRPEGVLWWSFYEREARFAAFLDEALIYASGGRVDPASVPSAHDKVRGLLGLLQRNRFLLVLDGFERELRAYAGLNAAYQGDVVTEDGQADFRACIDPHAGNFLRWLAVVPMQSRVLLTSRLPPRELEGLAGSRGESLDALHPDDAVIFFHSQGVKGTRAEIQAACERYGYHPLALRLLAGVILRHKRRPGDVRVADQYPVLPELKGKEQHHILQVAYDALDRGRRTLLSQISAFRSPMDYEALSVLNPYKSESAFDATLDELIERGLLIFDRERGCYDLHPIVRGYAYDRLADKEGVHTRLRDYFAAVPEPEQVESVEDLAPVIELYHHTVRAGHFNEAVVLYDERLSDPLFYRLGAYQNQIELLRALFSDGEDKLPPLDTNDKKAWTLNSLANAYSLSGQPRSAVRAFEVAVELAEKLEENETNVAIALGKLAYMAQIHLGELAAAEGNLQRSIELCREIEDEFWEAVGHQHLGLLLACLGKFQQSKQELAVGLELFQRTPSTKDWIAKTWAHRSICELFIDDPVSALEGAIKALELLIEDEAEDYPVERDFIIDHWLIGTAQRSLGDLDEAETHLTKALTRCRRINLVELEPDILLAWARWHQAQGNADQARQDAGEALAIADRCEYRLKQADIHNFLARLAWERVDELRGMGDGAGAAQALAEAREQAEVAKERAWCDGPPHCYKPALEEAERLLEEIAEATTTN